MYYYVRYLIYVRFSICDCHYGGYGVIVFMFLGLMLLAFKWLSVYERFICVSAFGLRVQKPLTANVVSYETRQVSWREVWHLRGGLSAPRASKVNIKEKQLFGSRNKWFSHGCAPYVACAKLYCCVPIIYFEGLATSDKLLCFSTFTVWAYLLGSIWAMVTRPVPGAIINDVVRDFFPPKRISHQTGTIYCELRESHGSPPQSLP